MPFKFNFSSFPIACPIFSVWRKGIHYHVHIIMVVNVHSIFLAECRCGWAIPSPLAQIYLIFHLWIAIMNDSSGRVFSSLYIHWVCKSLNHDKVKIREECCILIFFKNISRILLAINCLLLLPYATKLIN